MIDKRRVLYPIIIPEVYIVIIVKDPFDIFIKKSMITQNILPSIRRRSQFCNVKKRIGVVFQVFSFN